MLAPPDELQEDAFGAIRQWVTGRKVGPPTRAVFATVLEKAKADLRGLVPRFVDQLKEILGLRNELLVLPGAPETLARDVEALVPKDFLRRTPYAQLAHLPRYLKAMKLRAERAKKNPAKDAERAALLAPYLAAAERLRGKPGADGLRWLVEEFRVSLFAQELGTAEPVSAVKLDRALDALRQGPGPAPGPAKEAKAPAATAGPRPIVAAAVTEKKTAPVKSLNALDKLFGR
jgi:ATP-dependent helicase HrpA